MSLCLLFPRTIKKKIKQNLLNKTDNPGIDENNIPLLHPDPDDDDLDDYKTPIQAGQTRHHLQFLDPRKKKQHQLYG